MGASRPRPGGARAVVEAPAGRYHDRVVLTGVAATSLSRGQWITGLLLLAALAILGAGAIVIWARRWGASRVEAEPVGDAAGASAEREARVCPSCARRYPAGARFCAVDASPLAWVEGELAAPLLACPRCDRSYQGGVRFCPVDAEELVRCDGDHATDGHVHIDGLAGSDKICPVCAARYEVEAAFCGRDGTRLCPLN